MANVYCEGGYRIVPSVLVSDLTDGSIGDYSTGEAATSYGSGITQRASLTAMYDLGTGGHDVDNVDVTYASSNGGVFLEVSQDKIHWYDGSHYTHGWNNGVNQGGGWFGSAPASVSPGIYGWSWNPGFVSGGFWRYVRLTLWADNSGIGSPGTATLYDFRLSLSGSYYSGTTDADIATSLITSEVAMIGPC